MLNVDKRTDQPLQDWASFACKNPNSNVDGYATIAALGVDPEQNY